MTDNKNNGMITKIWGPPLWSALHSITFGYPIEPTNEDKNNYKIYFEKLGDVLPCKYCRESYKQFIKEGKTKLNDDVMESRETLTKWLYHLHNTVNNKLEVDYKVSYDDVVERYEKYRAKCSGNASSKGCLIQLNKNANPYVTVSSKDCPVIPISIIKAFIPYAKERNMENKYLEFAEKINEVSYADMLQEKNNNNEWNQRNQTCSNIINEMRINKTESIETSGKWVKYPTIDELKLILFGSSNLSKEQLNEIIANKIIANEIIANKIIANEIINKGGLIKKLLRKRFILTK